MTTGRNPAWIVAGVAVALLVIVSAGTWLETRKLTKSVDERFAKIENDLAAVRKQAAEARPAARQRRGVDPDRVHEIAVGRSPTLGPAAAPVTIVEVSDFQ